MPHKDFDAARREFDVHHDPITFDFMDRHWTVSPNPMLGDCFELADSPYVVAGLVDKMDGLGTCKLLCEFIGKMLVSPAERQAWTALTYEIPATYAPLVVAIAGYIAEETTGVPLELEEPSSPGPVRTGPTPSKRTGGGNPSQKRPRTSGSRSSTTNSRTGSTKGRS